MDTSARRVIKSTHRIKSWSHLVIIGAILVTLMAAALGPQSKFTNLALLSVTLSAPLTLITAGVLRVPILEWLLTPVGIMIGFMFIAFAAVPVLWALGVATPWSELDHREHEAVVAGLLMLFTFCLGVWIAAPTMFPRAIEPRPAGSGLSHLLLLSIVIGGAGYFILAATAGGPIALLHSLATRREVLAGTGPLRALIMVPAVACVAGIVHTNKSRAQVGLTWLCGSTYFATMLLTGSRYQALVVVVAALAAYVRVHGGGQVVRRWIGLFVIAMVPASTFYGLAVRTGLTYGVEMDVVDSTSASSFIASFVNPFVRGGFDSLRTLGAVVYEAPSFKFDISPTVGSIFNIVPRSLWTDKPTGSATRFSEEYFPHKWIEGTGVPPSVSAELMNSFGFVGAVIGMAILGYVAAKGTQSIQRKTSLTALLVGPFLTADALQLAKAGSDGFFLYLMLQLIAVAIAITIANFVGPGLKMTEQRRGASHHT